VSAQAASEGRVLVGSFIRERHVAVSFVEERRPLPPTVRRPAKIARMLALAHHIQRAIEAGVFLDRASVADRVRLTRARVTQLLDLLLLAPDIQSAVLDLQAIDGVEPIAEHSLRPLTRPMSWDEQRALWSNLQPAAPRRRSKI
jgi:hypothetical protein